MIDPSIRLNVLLIPICGVDNMERYLMLLLFLQPSWTLYDSFLCPSLSEWRFRSNWYCNGTSNERYTCLYHEIQKTFVESCIYKPDSLDPGEQYIISHHPRGVNCINEHRFQPFRILLNGGPECIFRRSMCSEEGQIIFNNGTFRDDRSCRCNFKKGFALNITTQHPCQCIPSKEDCSCYKKHCPTDYVLTPDYVCVHRNNRTYISSCPDISPKSSIKESDNKLKHKLNDDSHDIRQTTKEHEWLISALVLIIVILVVGFIFESVSNCFYCITCPPKDFTVSNEADYLKFTWSNPAYLPIPIKEYRIYFTITNQWNDEDFWPVEPDNLYFSKSCSDILPSRFYRFRISTYINNSHKSKHSDEIDICVPGDPPFNFNVTARKYLAFTWSKPNIGSDYIRHYNIYFTTDDSSSYNWEDAEPFSVTAEQLKHNWTDANIIPSKTYRFRISTYYDNSVESKQSNEITCVIGDVLPPKKFKSRGGNGTVELHWTKAENVLFQTEKYKIEVSTDNWQTIVTKKDISSEYSIYTITEVDLMKVYHFKIYSYSKGYFSEPEEDIFFAETAYEVRVPLNDDNIGNECADSNHPLNKSIKDESHDAASAIIEDVNQNLVVKHIDVKIGSVYVVIIIACEGFNEETALREAFKERLKRGFFGKFKASTKGFEFMTLNRPMPPQHIDVDTNGRNVQVSWSVPPQTFFRTKNFIIQYTTGDGKDPKEKLVSSEYLKCSILLDSSAKFIQLTMCTEIKKSIRSVPSSEKWTEIKHKPKETDHMETSHPSLIDKSVEIEDESTIVSDFKEKTLRTESSPSSLVDKSFEIMEERAKTADDTEDTLDMETCEHVPVDKLVEIDKESTVVSGLFDKGERTFHFKFDKDDTEDTLDMETCEHVPVDKLVEIYKESTVLSGLFDKDKPKETDHMEISHLIDSCIDKSVEIEDESTIVSDLDGNRKRWLIVGVCLHSFISPVLRRYVVPVVTRLFLSLISQNKIHKQTYENHLKKYEPTNTKLNYEAINNNKTNYGPDRARYDYRVKSPVDLSRLFLQTHMAHFTAFDESCDSPALLGIIGNIDRFPVVVQADAEKIRSDVQNHWINCVFTEWTEIKYDYAFKWIRQLISNLKLSNKEENRIKGKLHSLAKNGRKFLSGELLGFEVVKEISQQTHILSEYVKTLCTETDSWIVKVQNKLKDLENDLQNRVTTEHGEELLQHKLEIREWEQDQSTFVETRATRYILESLPTNNCIVVTGVLGCGKSANIHNAALHLRDSFGYEIVRVLTGPTDIINYYNENKKQVFVVDDICGKETVNMQTLQTWRYYSETMEKIFGIADKSVKNKTYDNDSNLSGPILLVSCRLHIYKESQLRLFTLLSRKECNLSSKEWGLLKEEKLLIENIYFPDEITEKMNVTNVREKVDFFPLFCKCSQYKSSEEVIKQFTVPDDTITKNIYHIVHTHKEQFCALVLCILFENGFDIHWLNLISVPKEMKGKLEDILKEFGIDLSEQMYRKSLKFGFSSLNCTYLKRRGTTYKMIHYKMYQLAAVICGQQLTECFIKYGPFTFIRDHYIFESILKGKAHDDLISLSDDKEEKYFERLVCDLKDRVLTSTFYNKQLKYQSFINKLICFFERNKEAIPYLRTLDNEGCKTKEVDYYETISSTPLIESASGGYYDIVKFLIDIVKSNVKGEDGRGRTSLYKAAEGGKINVVKLLLENNADVLQCNYDKESPLYVACKEGHKTTVELLLQNHANVLQCDNEEKSPLYVACEGGHKDIVEMLLNYKVDIFKCNYEERSPLFMACQGGHTCIVELLLQNNADISKRNYEEKSPLYVACEKGHADIVELLLQNNADVSECDYEENSPLYVACEGGHRLIVELLLQQNKVDISKSNYKEKSPFYSACEGGHTDIVELLLQNNADISRCNYEEKSPLFVACEGGHIDIVKLLLQNNADIFNCDNQKSSPLHMACHTNIVQPLLQKNADVSQYFQEENSSLFVACEGGYIEIVKFLLHYKADISSWNYEKKSPLFVACKGGHTNIVELLLQKNADVSQCDYEEKSPLYVACEGGHTDIVELLLQNNADISNCNNGGKSPLFVACEGGHIDIVKLLLQKNADISKCENQKKSPLHVACQGGHTYIVELLLRKKGDVSQSDDEIKLALFAACEEGHKEIVKLLLHYNASISKWNREEKSPLYMACERGHTCIVELFLQNNTDISNCNYEEKSPLYVACEKGHSNIVELLLQNNADISKCNYKDKSPLYVACEGGYTYIAKLLLQNNAAVSACKNEKRSSLYVACERGHINIVKLLLQNSDYLSTYYSRYYYKWESPLYVAASNGHRNIMELLMQSGFDFKHLKL